MFSLPALEIVNDTPFQEFLLPTKQSIQNGRFGATVGVAMCLFLIMPPSLKLSGEVGVGVGGLQIVDDLRASSRQ